MMKPRTSRVAVDQAPIGRNKSEQLTTASNGSQAAPRNQAQLLNQQPTSAQTIRKRRSSINVYDQPSSLNSRLRQLETDMLRLDEDRTKLFDDTHSALAQYELKLGEIHAILKSRQDNVEKYVEDMKMLLQAKEEFERQTKLLNEKNDRIHEKFMHRETTISREIKLLKNKFELLEKNRHFRSILQKSSNGVGGGGGDNQQLADDLISGGGLDSHDLLSSSSSRAQRNSQTTTSENDSFSTSDPIGGGGGRRTSSSALRQSATRLKLGTKSVRIKLNKFGLLGSFLAPIFSRIKRPGGGSGGGSRLQRRKSNKVSALAGPTAGNPSVVNNLTSDGGALGSDTTMNAGGTTESSHNLGDGSLPSGLASDDQSISVQKTTTSAAATTTRATAGKGKKLLGGLFK